GYMAWFATRGSNGSFNAGTLSFFPTATNLPGTPVTLGSFPLSLAVTPNGQTAYALNFSSNSVSVLDLTTSPPTVTSTIPTGSGTKPDGIAITPDGKTAYVSYSGTNQVTPITLVSGGACASAPCVGTPIPVGGTPEAIAITPDGQTAYVAN